SGSMQRRTIASTAGETALFHTRSGGGERRSSIMLGSTPCRGPGGPGHGGRPPRRPEAPPPRPPHPPPPPPPPPRAPDTRPPRPRAALLGAAPLPVRGGVEPP